MKLSQLKIKSSKLLLLNKNILKSFEAGKDVLDANIKYWLKNKELIAIKRGSYIIREKYDKEPKKDLYLEYLANQLLQPSYLSLEYVLAKYQILTESVSAITCMTTKTGREVVNQLGSFRYYSLSKDLFRGYKVKYFYNSPIAEATKSKALFDFLYLRFLKERPVNKESIKNLRLNWENINKTEFSKAYDYLKYTKSQRVKKVFEIIKKTYYA